MVMRGERGMWCGYRPAAGGGWWGWERGRAVEIAARGLASALTAAREARPSAPNDQFTPPLSCSPEVGADAS